MKYLHLSIHLIPLLSAGFCAETKLIFHKLILNFFSYIFFVIECPRHIRSNTNKIFIYSTQTSTYINATYQCGIYDGNIVQIPSEDRNVYYQDLEDIYLQGTLV